VDEVRSAPLGSAFGHGTHVTGIIAATAKNAFGSSGPTNVAGGCWNCSVSMQLWKESYAEAVSGIVRAVDIGSQVINMSFETGLDPLQSSPTYGSIPQYYCGTPLAGYTNQITLSSICAALTHAAQNGVAMAAAGGNHGNANRTLMGTTLTTHAPLYNLPAVHPDVMAVSGLELGAAGPQHWKGSPYPNVASDWFGSNYGIINKGVPQISFAAPAHQIISTLYTGKDHIPDSALGALNACGDGGGSQQPANSTVGDGIGYCTGTSMAAPHISAMAGLVKSANPLLDTAGVKSVLIQASECLGTDPATQLPYTKPCSETMPLAGVVGDAMKKLGYGVPKADKAVQIALGGTTATNRTTPRFAYFQMNDTSTGISQGHTHFYTTNPQMAIAAKRNTLQPAPRYKISPNTFSCAGQGACSSFSATNPITINATARVVKPDGANCNLAAGESCASEYYWLRTSDNLYASFSNVAPSDGVLNSSSGTLNTGMNGAALDYKIVPISTFPMRYTEIGLPIPGYPNLPCGSTFSLNATANSASNTACSYWKAKAIASLLTTHINPISGAADLKKLYRLSCAPEDICNKSLDAAKKPYHVTFRYVTDETLLALLTSAARGYKLDGIEGYVYPLNAPAPAGTKKLCVKRDVNKHDHILFLENTSYPDPGSQVLKTTTTCAGTVSDEMAGGFDYNQADEDGVSELGYAYPVDRPKALPDQPQPAPHSFNGDQYADIFWLNPGTQQTAVWFQNGYVTTPPAAVVTNQTTNAEWKVAAIADFDGDGKADILWRGVSGASLGKTKLWIMGGSTVISSTEIGIPGQSPLFVNDYEIAAVGDFNGDGRADILWRSKTSANHVMWFMQGASIMNNASVYVGAPNPEWKVVGVGDFNGDGKADLLWRNAITNDIATWLMNGAQNTLGQIAAGGVDPNWVVKGVADVTGDGQADIVWYHAPSGSVAIWAMSNGLQSAGVIVAGGVVPDWKIVGVRDFDGDKKADILWRQTNGSNAIWLLNGLSVQGSAIIDPAPVGWTVQPVIP
jgi:hypothetical protein